jgi:hypothetical protein
MVLRDVRVDFKDVNEGKKRPVLVVVVERDAQSIMFYPIYSRRNRTYRAKAVPINDWQTAGLDHLSFVDTADLISIAVADLGPDVTIAGKLSPSDYLRVAQSQR